MKNVLFILIITLFMCLSFSSCTLGLGSIERSIISNDNENESSTTLYDNEYKSLEEMIKARLIGFSTYERNSVVSRINSEEKSEFAFKYFDDSEGYFPDFSSTCYGKFGECSVWFLAGQACVITGKEIDGHKFIFPSSFAIKVEKNGEIYDLKDSFEKGILTKDDIAEIYQVHKEFVKQYYNGEDLYKEYE